MNVDFIEDTNSNFPEDLNRLTVVREINRSGPRFGIHEPGDLDRLHGEALAAWKGRIIAAVADSGRTVKILALCGE